ncbi:putative reverse transcriptase domain-containing protein [Tanacetum coccineum]
MLKLRRSLKELSDKRRKPLELECLVDANLHVPLDEIRVDKTLCFVEEPVEILDREIKKLKRRKIVLVKVMWNSKRGPKMRFPQRGYCDIRDLIRCMGNRLSVQISHFECFVIDDKWFYVHCLQYDLSKFCPYNTVLVDHGDPSINTVLTAPTDKPGVALLDFVIFPLRWLSLIRLGLHTITAIA